MIFGDFFENYAAIHGDLFVDGTPFEVSDRRAKTNIQPLGGVLGKVMSLNGVTFDRPSVNEMKGEFATGSIGVIAQEVESVYPELVRESRSGLKAVNYTGLVPVLLEAIKEQQEQIELLEQRISELEK